MRVKVIDYNRNAVPMKCDGLVYGRRNYHGSRTAWHIFRPVAGKAVASLCGKFILASEVERAELTKSRPRGQVCRFCQGKAPATK